MKRNQRPFHDTERRDLPSASSLERLAACPGSHRLSRGLPEISTPEMKAAAESGQRIHLYLEAPDVIDLSEWPGELELGQSCLRQRDELIKTVFGEDKPKVMVEERLWLKEGRKRVLSGRLDLAAWLGTIGLVIDYKSGRGEVTESSSNLQLRVQAVLLWEKKKLSTVCAAIIQPLKKMDAPTIYTDTDLASARDEIIRMLETAKAPDAPLNPGPKQCKFCPARLICPALKELMDETSKLTTDKIARMSPAEMCRLLDIISTIKPVIKTAEAAAKMILKDNAAGIPNWSIGEGGGVRYVSDVQGFFTAFHEAGLTKSVEEFLATCVEVKIGEAEKLARANKPVLKSDRDAKEALNEIAGAYLKTKTKEGSLCRVTE